MQISVTCLPGMEDILQSEIAALGVRGGVKARQAVEFEGNDEILLRCLTGLPSALRVYQQIVSFPAGNQSDLYRQLRKIKWERFLNLKQSFAIEAIESGGKAPGPLRYITLKAKDALVDYFRASQNARPSVDRNNPDIRFLLLFSSSGVQLMRDAAGRPLSQRGYRLRHTGAPLNETLAWGILNFAGFVKAATLKTPGAGHAGRGHRSGTPVLIDPMCGSGTISIEAARYLKARGASPLSVDLSEAGAAAGDDGAADASAVADPADTGTPAARAGSADIRPGGRTVLLKKKTKRDEGSVRSDFMCFSWTDKGTRLQGLSRKLENSNAVGGAINSPTGGGARGRSWYIIAADRDPGAVRVARENARRAGVEEYISFVAADFFALRELLSETDEGLARALNLDDSDPGDKRVSAHQSDHFLILNPPYDRRLALDEGIDVYRQIGDCMKQQWKGFSAHVFSANRDALKQIGLRSDKKTPLKNGQLQASLHSFSLY